MGSSTENEAENVGVVLSDTGEWAAAVAAAAALSAARAYASAGGGPGGGAGLGCSFIVLCGSGADAMTSTGVGNEMGAKVGSALGNCRRNGLFGVAN